jgi:O-antigen ligase
MTRQWIWWLLLGWLGGLAGAVFLPNLLTWYVLGSIAALGTALVHHKGWVHELYWAIGITLPWSVAMAWGGGSEVVVPGEILIVVLAGVLLLDSSKRGWTSLKQIIEKNPWPALWIASFAPAVTHSEMPGVSIKFWLVNGLFVAVFYYGTLRWPGAVPKMLSGFAWSMVGVALWGLYQYAQYDFNPITRSGIFKPFFYSHTYFGAVMAMGFGAGLAWLPQRRWGWALAILAASGVLLSGSRAALWSMVFVVGILPLMRLKPRDRIWLPLALIAGLLVAAGPQPWFDLWNNTTYKSHDPQANVLENSMSVTNVQTDVSNVERLNRWTSALRMFEERPHVGFGPGTYQFTYIPYQDPALENRLTVKNPDDPPEGSGGTAHSEWLLQLAENGWPSALLFLIILLRWAQTGFTTAPNAASAAFALFAPLATYCFHMHFNNFLNQPGFALLFWSLGAQLDRIRTTDSR